MCTIDINKIDTTKYYGFVYLTTNLINNRKYIGQRSFKKGWQNYLGSGVAFKEAIKKYGKENFKKEIIELAKSKDQLNDMETHYIKFYNAANDEEFYNISERGHNAAISGEKHWNYGNTTPESTKKKISARNKGYKFTNEQREHLRIAVRKVHEDKIKTQGYILKLTEEQKKVISNNRKEFFKNGGIHPKGMLGKTHNNNFKSKMSKRMSGENNPMYNKNSWDHLSELERMTRLDKVKNTWSNKSKKDLEAHKKNISKAVKGENNPRAKRCYLINLENKEEIKFGCIKDAAQYLFKTCNPEDLNIRKIEYRLKTSNENKLYDEKYMLKF